MRGAVAFLFCFFAERDGITGFLTFGMTQDAESKRASEGMLLAKLVKLLSNLNVKQRLCICKKKLAFKFLVCLVIA